MKARTLILAASAVIAWGTAAAEAQAQIFVRTPRTRYQMPRRPQIPPTANRGFPRAPAPDVTAFNPHVAFRYPPPAMQTGGGTGATGGGGQFGGGGALGQQGGFGGGGFGGGGFGGGGVAGGGVIGGGFGKQFGFGGGGLATMQPNFHPAFGIFGGTPFLTGGPAPEAVKAQTPPPAPPVPAHLEQGHNRFGAGRAQTQPAAILSSRPPKGRRRRPLTCRQPA